MSRKTLASVEAQLATANTRIAELEAALAARDARIAVATTVFKDQRALIRTLEAKLNTRGVVATTAPRTEHTIAPIVTRFTKGDGTVWEKTRIGNRAVSREITFN